MQIQYQESPRFNNIFICFGPIHIELAFFGETGHILAESGGPHILVDTGILAEAPLNGLISGKHFNQCKCIHPLLALAFRILHMGKFLRDYRNLPHDLSVTLSGLHSHLLRGGTTIRISLRSMMNSVKRPKPVTMEPQKGFG